MDIPHQIKTIRKAKKLSINACSMSARVAWIQWDNWENGIAEGRWSMLPRIATALGCDVADLVG